MHNDIHGDVQMQGAPDCYYIVGMYMLADIMMSSTPRIPNQPQLSRIHCRQNGSTTTWVSRPTYPMHV